MVRVSREAGRPRASPVSSGGASGRPVAAPVPTSRPPVIAAAALVHSLRSLTRDSRVALSETSKAAKCSRSWTGVAMPAWFSP